MYEVPSQISVYPIPGTTLLEKKEEARRVPAYLSSYSKLDESKKALMRKDHDIDDSYIFIFLDDKTFVHKVLEGFLSVYVTQL